jgi:predicted dehydrogenase
MSAPVGIGIIGAGVISAQYLTTFARCADVEARFVADLDVARAAARAAEFGVPASGTVEELLARDDVEIVVNLTIPAAHADVSLAALAAGKHVWTEKPFALDRAAARAVLDEAERRGLRVAGAPDTMLGAGMQTAFRAIRDGLIGRPLTALVMLTEPGPESWHPSPEFLFDVGGGPLFDMGPYYLTALVNVLGPVAAVQAVGSTARTTRVIGSGPRAGTEFPVRVPTHVSALLQFAGGGSATAVFSFESALRHPTVLEVTGTTGALALPDPNRFDGDSVVWRDETEEGASVPQSGPALGRGIGVVDLARAIREGRPERASGALAAHVLDVMLSIQDAAESGTTVRLASTAPHPEPLDDVDLTRPGLA